MNKFKINENIKWEKTYLEETNEKKIIWQKLEKNRDNKFPVQDVIENKNLSKNNYEAIYSFNRSIVFNNSLVGPDISWLVPPGFKWNEKYKFDASIRGHSGRFEKGRKGKSFWGWNSGDAVGQIYYQFLNKEKTSFGLNFGIRSVYTGNALGGTTGIGEGQSVGFRIDRQISPTEGFAFGAEQLLHLDGLIDTEELFTLLFLGLWRVRRRSTPLIFILWCCYCRMAEGNIKFLYDLLVVRY